MIAAVDVAALLRPRSIAIIGATERPDTWGYWMTRTLLSSGFPGTVYLVNRRAKTILGQPAYPGVCDVPETIDLAIIAIPAAQVFEAIRTCAAKVFLHSLQGLQETHQKPVLLVAAMTPLESQMVQKLMTEGLRFQHRLDDTAALPAALWHYVSMHGGPEVSEIFLSTSST